MKVHKRSPENHNLPFCSVRRVKLLTKNDKKVTCLACIDQIRVRAAAKKRVAERMARIRTRTTA